MRRHQRSDALRGAAALLTTTTLLVAATAACGAPGETADSDDPVAPSPGTGGDGQTLEDYCARVMIHEVVATPGSDGVTVTWQDGLERSDPTTYSVLRHIGDGENATGDAWAAVDTVELDDSDERRFVDHTVEPDPATRTLNYAVSVDDPNCGPSPICPEAPETCASTLLPGATTRP